MGFGRIVIGTYSWLGILLAKTIEMGKRIDCNSSCFLARKGCKDIRKCACNCGPLKAINPNLFDACVDQCNTDDRPVSGNDFMCNFLGGEVLFNNYGLLQCGYELEDSAQYIAFNDQVEAAQSANAGTQVIVKGLIVVFIFLITAGLASIIFK